VTIRIKSAKKRVRIAMVDPESVPSAATLIAKRETAAEVWNTVWIKLKTTGIPS
jgi:hypothetical protein